MPPALVEITADTASLVRAHLAELLASTSLRSSKRLGSFLTYVVEKTLAGEGGDLKEFVIATEVYGRSVSYDPQVDSTVRVEASRLRSKLREYYATEGMEAKLRVELPKGCYVPVFVPVAPEDSPEPGASPAIAPPLPVGHSRWTALLGVAMALLVSGYAVLRLEGRPTNIAANGTLASTSPARVYSPPEPLVERYLRADRLLRQRALKDGWSGEVPQPVLEAVGIFEQLTKDAPLFTEAWNGLAEAQEWAFEIDRKHPKMRLQAARAAAERALSLQPYSAPAHSRLAALHLYSYGDVNKAQQLSEAAIKLDPRDIRSHARYVDLLRAQAMPENALAAVRKALTLNPTSPRLWSQQALLLSDLSRMSEAMSSANHALELTGGNEMNQLAIAHWVKGLCLQQQGMLDGAEAEFRKGLEVAPQDERNQAALGNVLAQQGQTTRAAEILSSLQEQHAKGRRVAYGIGLVYAGLGRAAKAQYWVKRSEADGEYDSRVRKYDKRLTPAVNEAVASLPSRQQSSRS
ncbi:MAG: tetratricopeptide repeat protein [Bryobacteraceae bacterium]|nr:tetratricopeptide repeat protein [Bryobacteraceae bacterium]